MEYSLSFEKLINYDIGEPGITVPARLKLGDVIVEIDVKLDCGSSFCIFERLHALALGIEIESGHRQRIGTATGSFIAYGHSVTLLVKGYEFDSVVYFAEDESITRNVLGRHGFLDRVQIGLIDYFGQLYLSRIGDHL